MFKNFLVFLIILSLFVISCSSKPSGPNLKEGKWEITISMEAKGQMPFKMPPQTYTQCITREKAIPQSSEFEQNQQCKFIKKDTKDDTISWILECKAPQDVVVSEGTITYKGDKFDGFVKVKHSGMDFTQQMSGKWIGECK